MSDAILESGPSGPVSDANYPIYDVLVIGAGHAGIEAALAAARMGAQVAMLTQNLDAIGQMSCNPAIGGLAKGHMVREIDALGGAMGLNADATAIQCRVLNASKGPSVRGPRAQCDKKAYQFRMKAVCESQPGLDLHQGNVARLVLSADGGGVEGAETVLGVRYRAATVVVTTGTFMRGLLHVGQQAQAGGHDLSFSRKGCCSFNARLQTNLQLTRSSTLRISYAVPKASFCWKWRRRPTSDASRARPDCSER